MTVQIEAYCQSCKKLISGKNGVVHVRDADYYKRMQDRRRAENRVARLEQERGLVQYDDDGERVGTSMSGGDMLDIAQIEDEVGPLVEWQVHCNACNPHPATEDGEIVENVWCEGCYWWDVDRIATWSQLMDWQRHLKDKTWFEDTDWTGLLQNLDDSTPSGLRFAGVVRKVRLA